jgi:hypothetical protein
MPIEQASHVEFPDWSLRVVNFKRPTETPDADEMFEGLP